MAFTARALVLMVTLFIPFLVVSCSEKEFDPNDPKKSFGIAKEPFDDGYYEEALRRLGEFKARFPYSQFASEAELLMADTHFLLGHFGEAALAYDAFVKLHPKHPKTVYALYRIAESYWEDAPEEPSREQEYTERAITQWKEVIEKFPQSEYASKAKDMVVKGRRRLAASIQFIARFYCKQKIWHSCAYRYTELLDKYPEQKDMANEALEKAAFSLEQVAAQKEKNPESDKNLYHRSMNAQQIREKAEAFRRILKG
jgi:outer membrane protein assembly factor BamD